MDATSSSTEGRGVKIKPNIFSKIIYIVLFGFFGSPFLLLGLLAGAAWIALKTGWWWAETFGEFN